MSLLWLALGAAAGKLTSDLVGRKYLMEYGSAERAEQEVKSRAPADIEFLSRPGRKLAYIMHEAKTGFK